jgi:hypothetical protein
MSNSLQQINLAYVAEQDRLLLRVLASNDHEFRIWLTRRYTVLLLQVLQQQIDKAGGFHEVAAREETLQQLRGGAFEHPYDAPPDAQYPLGAAGVLGYRINVSRNDEGRTELQLLPEQGQGLNITLNKSTLYMLYNLLEQALSPTDWNLQASGFSRHELH